MPPIIVAPVIVTQLNVLTGLNINVLSFAPVNQILQQSGVNWSFNW
jgi:hypothetical protein